MSVETRGILERMSRAVMEINSSLKGEKREEGKGERGSVSWMRNHSYALHFADPVPTHLDIPSPAPALLGCKEIRSTHMLFTALP